MKYKFKRYRIDKLSKEEIILELIKVAGRFNYTEFGKREFTKFANISHNPVVKNFQSWSNAIKELRKELKAKDIELKPRNRKFISNKELFDEMERIWKCIGHRPSRIEWDSNNPKYSLQPYKTRFGGWKNACLKFLQYKMGKSINIEESIELQNVEKDKIEFDNVKIIRSRVNLGFSGGNMLGVSQLSADYYLFLNNDTVLENDFISVLYEFMESNRKVGLCTGQVLDKNKNAANNFDYLPEIGLKVFGKGLFRLLNKNKYPSKKVLYDKPVKVPVVSGSAMFVRASMFDKLGGLDTMFFLYCEEEDLAIRTIRAGYDVFYVPEAKYIHYGSESVKKEGKINLKMNKEYYISLFHFYRKHYHRSSLLLLKVFLFIKFLTKCCRDKSFLFLAIFIIGGANEKHSLRYKTEIGKL